MKEPRAYDFSHATRWYPFVTFFQVTVDMLFANGVPRGHGHRYGPTTVDAWARITPPAGWTPAMTEALRRITVKGWSR